MLRMQKARKCKGKIMPGRAKGNKKGVFEIIFYYYRQMLDRDGKIVNDDT